MSCSAESGHCNSAAPSANVAPSHRLQYHAQHDEQHGAQQVSAGVLFARGGRAVANILQKKTVSKEKTRAAVKKNEP
eukprot:3616460-Lingulodinium_polyedra.AAC.1